MRPTTERIEIKYVLDCPLHPRVTPTKLYCDVKKSRYFIIRVASRSRQYPLICVMSSPCTSNPATSKKAKKNMVVHKHGSCREK